MNYKFRKKPVVVEAFQMTEARGSDNAEWPQWLNEAWNAEAGDGPTVVLPNASGTFTVPSDWIIDHPGTTIPLAAEDCP